MTFDQVSHLHFGESLDISSLSTPLSRDQVAKSGWSFLDQLELDCLSCCMVPTVKQIRPFLQARFRECSTIPLQLTVEDSSNEAAWKLFLLLPRLLLQPERRGGQSGRKSIEKRYSLFMDERWHELYLSSEPSRPLRSDESEMDHSGPLSAKLIQSVRCKIKDGGISKAANLFTSAGVAPYSEDTIAQLKKKHPPRKDPGNDCQEILTPVCPPLQITWSSFGSNI